jgi:hypothetical protein
MSASDSIRALHGTMRNAIAQGDDGVPVDSIKEWKSAVAHIYKAVVTSNRHADAERERMLIERAIIKEEMRDELVSREAIAARTAERFRALGERGGVGGGNGIDRAFRTAASIDACINQLSCHALSVNQGTVLLHEQSGHQPQAWSSTSASEAQPQH